MLQGVAAISYPEEAKRGPKEVGRLMSVVQGAADNCGNIFDKKSQRLPLRAHVALLGTCSLSMRHRSYGELIQIPRLPL